VRVRATPCMQGAVTRQASLPLLSGDAGRMNAEEQDTDIDLCKACKQLIGCFHCNMVRQEACASGAIYRWLYGAQRFAVHGDTQRFAAKSLYM
jgi:hypothetical protein